MNNSLVQQYMVHLDSIIKMYDDESEDSTYDLPEPIAYGIIARARGTVEKITGRHSYYTQQVQSILDEDWIPSYKGRIIVGIVAALRGELQDGYLAYLGELVHGEIFSNFLEMAEYLLTEGFKDAAAVIAGSTLEAHLRQLCIKHSVDIELTLPDGSKRAKRASRMNDDLAKVAYSTFDQKQVAAWLDLRNSAAHGKYEAYTDRQVEQFVEWLRDFIRRNPA